MRRLVFLILAGCWTSQPHAIEVPKQDPKAAVWKKSDSCENYLTRLWQIIDSPPDYSDVCDDSDPDYWWCMYNIRANEWNELNNVAYWAVLECDNASSH